MGKPSLAEIVIDAEIQSLIPPPNADELKMLEENILAEGQCHAKLIAWDRGEDQNPVLLDGHNRRDVISRHWKKDIAFDVHLMTFPDRNAAIAWVIRNQLGRRNITAAVRVQLAEKLEPMLKAKAKENQQKSGGAVPMKSSEPVDTRQRVAEEAGVSPQTVSKVKSVVEKAVPEVKGMMDRGEVSINAAAKVAELPKKEQKKAAKKGAAGVKAAAKEARAKPATTPVPSPLSDEEGMPIPESLAGVFDARGDYDAILNALTKIAVHFNRLTADPSKNKPKPAAGHHLEDDDMKKAGRYLHEMRQWFKFGRPHAVCPRCKGADRKCLICKGLGWLVEAQYKNVPDDEKGKGGKS